MAKENTVLIIDVGAENLKMAEFSTAAGSLTMTAFAIRKFELEEGMEVRDVFADYYNDMIAQNGFTAKAVRLSLSAQNSFQRLSKLPPILGNRTAVSKLVEFEASQTVPCSIDEIEWDYQLQRHEWDEMVEEENEEGGIDEISVHREEFEALFVALKTEDMVCFTDVIEASGKYLLSVDVAPVALFNAATAAQIKSDECVLVLNIGSASSSLMISDHRRVFLRNIPIGGAAITAAVSREFGVKSREAEDFKRRYGFVALGGAYEDPESELAATISKLSRNVMTRLHGEVSRSISVWRAQHGGSAPERVLLSGGGSTMLYTQEFFQEKLRLPVEYLNCFSLINLAPQIDKEFLQSTAISCQELIGVALHLVGRCPVDMNLLPREIKAQMILNARKPFFYASGVTLLACLLIFVSMVGNFLGKENKKLDRSKQVLKDAQQKQSKIQSALSQLQGAKGDYDNAKRLPMIRNEWAAYVNELQTLLPNNMWLTKLEYRNENQVNAAAEQAAFEEFGDTPGGSSSNAAAVKMMSAKDFVNLGKIVEFSLAGYIIRGESGQSIDDDFNGLLMRFNNSKYFKVKTWKLSQPDTVYGLAAFEVTLTMSSGIGE